MSLFATIGRALNTEQQGSLGLFYFLLLLAIALLLTKILFAIAARPREADEEDH